MFLQDFAHILANLLLSRSLVNLIDSDTLCTLARLVLVRQPAEKEPDLSTVSLGQLICLSLASGIVNEERLMQLTDWIVTPITEDAGNRCLEDKLCVVICLKHVR